MPAAPLRLKPQPHRPEISFEKADVGALQALERGDAQPHQQQRALRFIMKGLCGWPGSPFDHNSDRLTAYLCGRHAVGQDISFLLAAIIAELKDDAS